MKIESEKIDIIDINDIVINPKNRNHHSEKQINVLSKIIKLRGFRDPLVISKRSGFLISGHARLEAAKKIGMDKIPVIFQNFKDEAEEYAHLIAVNEIARYSEFDQTGFIEDLKGLDLNINELDFEEFGKLDFNFTSIIGDLAPVEKPEKEDNEKYIIEVQFPNEMEMMDIYDDLISRGYIAKIKQGGR